jgi:DNA repair protein RadA
MSTSEILEINDKQIKRKTEILWGFEVLQKHKQVLNTGSKNFDDILGGGFQSLTKYLIFGANKTGKTQLCHQLCVQAYNQFSRIFENNKKKKQEFIFYFDTENTFRPERIRELILNSEIEYKELLKKILVSKIMSNSALLLSLKELEKLLKINDISMLIIDTLNNHYNSELANKQISSYITRKTFIKILDKINQLTKDYNLITITTAQVISNLNRDSSLRALPSGNQLLNQYFSEYLYLDYKEQDKRYVQLVNSLKLPEKRLLYKITSSGIQDYNL